MMRYLVCISGRVVVASRRQLADRWLSPLRVFTQMHCFLHRQNGWPAGSKYTRKDVG